ncbi:MAG: ATP-dependent helicase [Bryobacteraceae bacterium]|nr:ATP-dependent helicase [Bryobacteraceae bacterium]
MVVGSWSLGLTGLALEVARAPDARLRVRAGPGTGKTFALMRRVMRLLEEGIAPERILVSTFTRTAARDLEAELAQLQIPGADRVRVGTLHSFSFSLLSRHEVLTLTGRVPRPLLKFEERFLLQDLKGINNEGVRGLRKRLDALAAAWARLQSDQPGWPRNAKDRTFHAALLDWLRFHEAMLIAEIVPEALRLVRDNPASPSIPRFDHVLVDEYQDLNRAEQVLLRELARDGHLAVVGDENQSIYSFKFAHPEGILRFHQENPGTRDLTLIECQRCPRLIVELANALISNNTSPEPRALVPAPAVSQGEVHIVQWGSLQQEAEGLARFVKHAVESDLTSPGGVLVLAPRRQIGYAIRDALKVLRIAAHSFFYEEALEGDPKELEASKAQQAFTLLTLLIRPGDRVALRCWCGFGSPSLNSGAWGRLRQNCEKTGSPPGGVLEGLLEKRLRIPQTGALVGRYRELKGRVAQLVGLTGYHLLDSLFPAGEEWAEGLRVLVPQGNGFSAQDLLEALRTAITQPEMPTNVDYVRVMSLHKAKGLSADLVVIAGCVEGLIPATPDAQMSSEERNRMLEEQRRLFYVAMTRTRRTLVLSSVTRLPRSEAYRMRAHVGRGGATVASRFLNELGPSRPMAENGQAWLRRLGVTV